LRRAVAARGGGCEFPGCGRPPSWCEVHHLLAWQEGGATALHNLAMVCRVHHRLLHHSEWIVRVRDGLPEFVPPGWIDPQRRPGENLFHTSSPPADRPIRGFTGVPR
jgi:5-methylcytosine-specific restriction protein A